MTKKTPRLAVLAEQIEEDHRKIWNLIKNSKKKGD